MIPNVGPLEIIIVLVVALAVFGPKRLPELGGSLGKGIRGFGQGLKGPDGNASLPEEVSTVSETEAKVPASPSTTAP
jgi:sec-independent protein translocase protein TatA